MSDQMVWFPDASKRSQLQEFMEFVHLKFGEHVHDYLKLHAWSVSDLGKFWQALAEFYQLIFEQQPQLWFKPAAEMWQAEWLSGARLNYCKNILERGYQGPAILAYTELGECHRLDYVELVQQVAACVAFFKKRGIQAGDRVVGMTTNQIPSVVVFLACAALGAIWANCSPDFGELALLERFQQLEPKLLVTVPSHHYNGKSYSHETKVQQILVAIPSIHTTLWLGQPQQQEHPQFIWDELVCESHALVFESLDYDHPLFILFTSGTTGKPKCVVHRAGGVLLEHIKDLGLHCDLRMGDRLLFYTTTGWMMWNWMLSALALGTTIVLYEGSPAYPSPGHLLEVVADSKTTVFGASAAWFASLEQMAYQTASKLDLTAVRTVLSTGSPLLAHQYDYIQALFGSKIQISSISGGTDIVSCFALGNPVLPVYRGELQCVGLGLDVQIFNEQGEAIFGEKGELVCVQPFPTIPLGFWGDTADQQRFRQAYFSKFPHVWAHGDYACLTSHHGLIIFGRSDATLNPHGIRFGSAELYLVVNQIPGVKESIAVSQNWENDTRVLLFVVLDSSLKLNATLRQQITQAIRQQLSPRHVPAKILQVSGIPKTLNGKLMELVVMQLIQGQSIPNRGVIMNPECLHDYENLAELKT